MEEAKQFRIDYRLTGSGWAECDVAFGEAKAHLTASYLSDALGQLVGATVLMLLGAPCVRASFDEEPGEYRWGLDWHRSADGSAPRMRVRVWWFEELWGWRPDEEGKIVFDQIVEAAAVYRAVLEMLDRVLAAYGIEGYAHRWHPAHGFPVALHEELRRQIKMRPDLAIK